MSAKVAVAEECLPDIAFTCVVRKNNTPPMVTVDLFLEGQKSPVGTVPITSGNFGVRAAEEAFYRWVVSGQFIPTVQDLLIRSILTIAQHERVEAVDWRHRTHRFLSRTESVCYGDTFHFMLTKDKSDVALTLVPVSS